MFPKRKTKSATNPPLPPRHELTTDEIAAELALRKQLLIEAQAICKALGQVRSADDFKACHDRTDALWHIHHQGIKSNCCDVMFISDCCRYCREAKLGAEEHSDAIRVIKTYMSFLRDDIKSPPTFYV